MPRYSYLKWIRVGAALLLSLSLLGIAGHDPAGAANGSVAYTYDALGRVVTVSYDTGVCIVYAYDPNGNRTSETIRVAGTGSTAWGTAVWGCFNWTPH